MMAMFRLALVCFVGLTVAYVLVSIYSRSLRREELEKTWDAAQGPGERADFIDEGMRAYEHGLRKKLIWLVYVIPIALIAVTIYLVNYQ